MTYRASSPFSSLSIAELVQGYARGDFSPVEVARASLERAQTVQSFCNAFVLIDEGRALKMAQASEQRWLQGKPAGLLDGVPVAVKDTTGVRGWPTRFGSLSGRRAEPAVEDSPFVERMREHGAVFIGKTAAPEFAWKGITDSALHGVTRNPWNTAKTPGGSSGGSAVAVATGVVPLATAADGGGSIRIPASFTGLYGLKPTAGLIANTPGPLGTLAVVGGVTRNVDDTARFLQAVVAPDARDSFAYPTQAPVLSPDDGDLRGLKIGVSADLGFRPAEPEIASVLADTVTHLRALGAEVESVFLRADDVQEGFETLWAVGFAEILGRLPEHEREQVEPALCDYADTAADISGLQVQFAYRQARLFSARMASFFSDCDLLLTPTVPILPFDAGLLMPAGYPGQQWWHWSPMTWPFNLSRNPAASCPMGMSSDGLPIGIQLVGRWFDESTVLRVSRALERFRPFPLSLADRAFESTLS